jgi:hypothetical protein
MINITLDLETLSTETNAAIIQIGACVITSDRRKVPLGISCEFEGTIRYEDCLKYVKSGMLHQSEDTMQWWDKQDRKVQTYVFSGQNSYIDVLSNFATWISTLSADKSEIAVWGNGSDFDNRILTHSLDAFGLHGVWSYRGNRDLRTLCAIHPLVEPLPWSEVRHGIKHTALADARYEADQISLIKTLYGLSQL